MLFMFVEAKPHRWGVCACVCFHWHCREEQGNRKSDFTETGARFKEDSNYPPLIELKLKKTATKYVTQTNTHAHIDTSTYAHA